MEKKQCIFYIDLGHQIFLTYVSHHWIFNSDFRTFGENKLTSGFANILVVTLFLWELRECAFIE